MIVRLSLRSGLARAPAAPARPWYTECRLVRQRRRISDPEGLRVSSTVNKKPERTQPPYTQIIAAIEEIPGLESLSEWLVKVLAPVTRRRTLMDLLHGRWLGH